MNPSRVRQYLSNPKEQEKAKGLKWLLGMMSKGANAAEFFADVVKTVVSKQVPPSVLFGVADATHRAPYATPCFVASSSLSCSPPSTPCPAKNLAQAKRKAWDWPGG